MKTIVRKSKYQEGYYKLIDFFKDNRSKLVYKSKGKTLSISDRVFKRVIRTYFDIVFEKLFLYGDEIDIATPLIGGDLKIRRKVQTRSYHVLTDTKESLKQGRIVKYKIPILDDYYTTIIWDAYNSYPVKVFFAKAKTDQKKEFVKEKGIHNFKLKMKKPIHPDYRYKKTKLK